MNSIPPNTGGWFLPEVAGPSVVDTSLRTAIEQLDTPFAVVRTENGPRVLTGGSVVFGKRPSDTASLPLLAWVPALTPDMLGNPTFCHDYRVRVPYMTGAMANGIASVEMVIAMSKAGMIGMFGAAGLRTAQIEEAIDRIQSAVDGGAYGINLIHSPQEPLQEQKTVDLLLAKEVRHISASAFMQLTEPLVQYRVAGLQRNPDGSIQVLNRIMAKVSREEVALHFLNPPPDKILNKLVARGIITDDQKTMALVTPMADDLISEANSGGHTDQRSAPVLLPLLISLRDKVCANTPDQKRVRVGAAGGLGTPNAIAGAFATGADFVLTGSVNQACIEAGTSSLVREMLSQAGAADVSMAPSSDMFEVGAKVQVLKRGTLFAMRASQLYDLYRTHDSLDEIPPETIQTLETQLFKMPIGDVWSECERFFEENDQSQLDRATTDPRHKMALIFRWYLGKSSKWATTGDKTRKMDAQIWCGPAIGSFNNWVTGSPLEAPENRDVVTVAANLMAGAAAITRARWLGYQGVNPGPDSSTWTPRKIAPISATPDEF